MHKYNFHEWSDEGMRVRDIRHKIYGIYQPKNERKDWLHMVRVADEANNYAEEAVALCHDVVEDGFATDRDLFMWGLTVAEREAVHLLTRPQGKSYRQYIQHIIDNALSDSLAGHLAVRVKYYDLFDHLHPDNIDGIDSSHVMRYTEAITSIATLLNLHKAVQHERQAVAEISRTS